MDTEKPSTDTHTSRSQKGKGEADGTWSYEKAPQGTDGIHLDEQYELFIDGAFVEPHSGTYFDTANPATEAPLARIATADEQDVSTAVAAARKAYEKSWSVLPAHERGKYIFRLARMIQERALEFAIVESMDGGKPIRESREVDVPLAAAHFFYYAGWADKLPYAFPNKTVEPIGVAAQIIPWNFPLLMLAWKIAPALATGNTVVLKPAETTSLTALLFAELCRDAGLPDGVVNIVTGAADTGQALVDHPDIDNITFTGSTAVGKQIMRQLAGSEKKYSLELGGKGPTIVFDDAPLDQAVEGIIQAIFFNQGHVCCAGSRLLVQESIADRLVQKLRDRMDTLIVGDPLDKNTDIGAINSKPQYEKIMDYLETGTREGGKMYQSAAELPESGYFCKPTLFTNVSQSSRIVQEEIFGPVLTIQTFRTAEEGIEKANNTPYGLSGSVWTDKGSKALKTSRTLRNGVLWSNTYNQFDPTSPFGGYKESGIGREGGLQGLQPYVNLK